MAHVLACRDVGVDCPAEFRGANTEEVLAKAMKHGREEHGLQEMSPELQEKIRQAIKEEPATY
jgi:predicted small metal-binding protein